MTSREEELLQAIINGDDVSGWKCRSRVEEYLLKCCCGETCDGMKPKTRIEALLKQLADKMASGGSGGSGADYLEIRLQGDTPYEYQNSNITKLTNYAFYIDKQLKGVDLPNVVTIGKHVFYSVNNLRNVNLPNVETIGEYAFYTSFITENVELISLPKLKTMGEYAFRENYYNGNNAIGLLNISLPKIEKIPNGSFYQCRALKSAYIGNCTEIDKSSFNVCPNLVAIIITQSNSVATLKNTNALGSSAHFTDEKDGYVYVPDTLVDSYKSATNWSTYASQIKGLSELPQEYKDLYGI